MKQELDPNQMCCVRCGHISPMDELYESTTSEGVEWDICPNCGGDNVGGYPCYAMFDLWPEDAWFLEDAEEKTE